MRRPVVLALIGLVAISGCLGSTHGWRCNPLVSDPTGSDERLYEYSVLVENRTVPEVLFLTSLVGQELRRARNDIANGLVVSNETVTSSPAGKPYVGRNLVLTTGPPRNLIYNLTVYGDGSPPPTKERIFRTPVAFTRIRFAAIEHDVRIVRFPHDDESTYRITFSNATAERFDSLLRERLPRVRMNDVRPNEFHVEGRNPVLVDRRSFSISARSDQWSYSARRTVFNRSSLKRNTSHFDEMNEDRQRAFLGSIVPNFVESRAAAPETERPPPDFVVHRGQAYHCMDVRPEPQLGD